MSNSGSSSGAPQQDEDKNSGPNLVLIYTLMAIGLLIAIGFAVAIVFPFYLRR